MGDGPNRRVPLEVKTGWLERIIALIIAAALILLGFFFLAAALIAGSVIAAVIIARWWWLARKLRRTRDQNVFETEYTVVERSERIRPPDQ